MLKQLVILYCIATSQWAISTSESRADAGELNLFEEPISYDVESTVLLNELQRKDKEVSYKIKARLNVLPVWSDPGVEVLLKFELLSPNLLSRGKSVTADYLPTKSIWDSYSHSTFYAHRKHGLIETAYLDPGEPTEIQNFKRALISPFQFRSVSGEGNETDVSGTCEVQYETTSPDTIRKYKTACAADGWAASGALRSRRATRYSLSAARDALRELHAEELHELGGAGGAERAALKARAWLQLRAAGAPAGAPRAGSLTEALAALPGALRAAALPAAPLAVPDPLADHESPEAELAAAAAEAEAEEEAEEEEGGDPRATEAARRLARALRAAPAATPAALGALLHEGRGVRRLRGACAALGRAGAAHTHAAAERFLRLRARDAPPALAHAYLEALALAPQPQASVVEDVLRLGEEVSQPALAESALLAGAAAARRLPAVAAAARDALARGLARCKSDECRRVRIAALGNLRRADTVELLLQHAEGGARGPALAALDALGGLVAALRPPARLRRLEHLALGARPLVLRAAALDLLLRCSADAPFGLPRLMLELHEAAPLELLRLAWKRLHSLAEDHALVRKMIELLPKRLRGWDVQAMAGTSSVLVRDLGAAEGWRLRLESVQVASGGLLRRGRVGLLAVSPDNDTDETLTVELWTRGLDAVAGDGTGSDDEEEGVEASGGLALGVGGARIRSLTLFERQSELLGHVWAGTGSEPTAVLRAARAAAAGAALPLLDGAALRVERDALLALALDAAAQVSLWSRTARSQLELRGSLSAALGAGVRAAGATLRARTQLRASPRLYIEADLDFYDGNTLCVRAHTGDCERSYNATLESEVGARRVWRARSWRARAPGRTLSLGRINDSLCRVLTVR